jgi:hypothetical protein
MGRAKHHAIKAALAAIITSVIGWPVWVTKNLYEMKTDIALIRQGIDRIARTSEAPLVVPPKMSKRQRSYAKQQQNTQEIRPGHLPMITEYGNGTVRR